MVRASAGGLQGPGFDCGQRHVPRSQARSLALVGVRAGGDQSTRLSHIHVSLSGSPPLFHSL